MYSLKQNVGGKLPRQTPIRKAATHFTMLQNEIDQKNDRIAMLEYQLAMANRKIGRLEKAISHGKARAKAFLAQENAA